MDLGVTIALGTLLTSLTSVTIVALSLRGKADIDRVERLESRVKSEVERGDIFEKRLRECEAIKSALESTLKEKP